MKFWVVMEGFNGEGLFCENGPEVAKDGILKMDG